MTINKTISGINCKAFVIEQDKKQNLKTNVKNIFIENPKKGELIIKNKYSSINHKDLMMIEGNPGLLRKFPHVPGIDAAGIIFKSSSKKFKKGDKVIIIAKPLGIKSFGGFSEYIKVPEEWVKKLPKKISLKDAMIIGTAGFTALMVVTKIRKKKSKNPILVTGASGGVGSIAIFTLSKFGFRIFACTSNKKKTKFLKSIGAEKIIDLSEFRRRPNMPLFNIKYSSIIDNVGGDVVNYGMKELEENGEFFSIGNILSQNIEINVLPLILRGIKIIGINAESSSKNTRNKIWDLIKILVKDKKIKRLYSIIRLNEINKKIKENNLDTNGRIVIKID